MQHLSSARVAAVVLACALHIPVGWTDALHKFGNHDAYWHHGSGWIYLRNVAGFELVNTPYQIDGNDDVGAEYAMELNGMRRTALVDIYYPSSAANGAKLETAKAAMQASPETAACAMSVSAAAFAVEHHADLAGIKTVYTPRRGENCARLALYFFETADWVVTIRTTAEAADTGAANALDTFVGALRWDTLGTDPFQREGP